jgi:hypothetical protein
MITKRFVLATSLMVLVALSGQVYAGTTISDKRYWPSEASSADQNAVQRRENTFDSAETPRGIRVTRKCGHADHKHTLEQSSGQA